MDLPEEDLPDLGFRWPTYVLSWPRIIVDWIAHSPRKGERLCAQMGERAAALHRLELDALSTRELAAIFTRSLRESFGLWDLLYLVRGAAVLPLLYLACRDWLGDQDLSLAYRLFGAQGGMADTEGGLALWRLATLAHADERIEAVLLAESDWSSAASKLQRSERGRDFLAAWEAFLAEHGHHCRGELELGNPRWSEEPDYLLSLVRGYLPSVERLDPFANRQRLAREREELTRECGRRLANPLKRRLFLWSLKKAQQLAIRRENWKDTAVRQIAGLRRLLLHLGGRLAQEGALDAGQDIFFLKVFEVEPVACGAAGFDVKRCVRSRRAEHEANQALQPPPVVIGRFDAAAHTPLPLDRQAKSWQGLPVWPGVVEGKARVILRDDQEQSVRPGEILVAPFIDPAWTPYFVPAAGVVMDQGGILSHGSIIAREYGIPAITNVGPASKIIRTGQTLHLDATAGTVTIVDALPG
jgi:pyruvate,water dikinase